MVDLKVLPPGSYVFFNEDPIINDYPPARDAIMRIYEQWLHRADPHIKTDNQQALRFLFEDLTQRIRPIIPIPAFMRIIAVRGQGFQLGALARHREAWFTVGIPEARAKAILDQQVQLANFVQQQDLARRIATPQAGDPRFGVPAVADPFRDAVKSRLASAMKAEDRDAERKPR